VSGWRDRFQRVEEKARADLDRTAPMRARNVAMDDLYEEVLAGDLIPDLDDVEVLQDLLGRATSEVRNYRREEAQR